MRIATFFAVAGLLLSSVMHADDKLHEHSQYHLHPGDTLSLDYRLSPELNQTATIGPDGFVDLSLAGTLKLSGLTLQQAHDLIVERDSARLNAPELNLQLKDFQHPYVMVAGQVLIPGKIEMREDMTALQAVMLAGGFKDSARETKVVVFRRISGNSGMAEVLQLNLHRIHKTKQLEQDLSLEPGDIIYIPENMATQFSKFMRIPNFSASAGVPAF
ncbi:polysaccharide biosynthesis/export family protein [Granulicella tundricola]|uniref:Soluble ligand binding domain protein n=1 Tax=Granulicella tundricola (strain ATCC BAA-1859 / DSM 23138 / MP5ACTX9) TaxID=1198114 RepID=E8X7S8_GRATM|nr:polysaccharide biosynthesis/export family protein [Granulicella tundricola]ADW71512.1 Soluble ligand binding domain protein [Granulicella tundricola MP5ACTX9]